MATIEPIHVLIAELMAAYPNASIPAATIAVYVKDLADIPLNILELACAECRATCKWFPTIAEIRAQAGRIQSGVDLLPPAGEAWGEAMKIIRMLRYQEQPVFDNPVTAKTIKAMGLRSLMESENPIADRARFIELYNQYVARQLNEFVSAPAVVAENNKALSAMGGLAKQLTAPTVKKE